MKSETLSLKIIINELVFQRRQLLFNETCKKKRFIVARKHQWKKYLILVMLKNTINHLEERKTKKQ